jgi:hypothetical protein
MFVVIIVVVMLNIEPKMCQTKIKDLMPTRLLIINGDDKDKRYKMLFQR